MEALEAIVGEIAARMGNYLGSRYEHNTYSIAGLCRCGAHVQAVSLCLAQLVQSGAWLPRRETRADDELAQYLECSDNIICPSEGMVQSCLHHSCARVCRDLLQQFREEIEYLNHEAKNVFGGACLDCFKSEGESEGKCRFNHEAWTFDE